MHTLKIIAALLNYPSPELQHHAQGLIDRLEAEALLKGRATKQLSAFIRDLAAADLIEAQSYYIDTFDRGRSLSLHLFEHVHGESRDRGQAMVDLQDMYLAKGLQIGAHELPDYLPLFLEFCSYLEWREAREWLADVEHILQLLHARLVERDNSYAAVLGALTTLIGKKYIPDSLRSQVQGEARDDTPEALDRVWEEAPVSFGGGSCPPQCSGQAPQVNAAETPIRWMEKSVAGDASP